MTKYIIESKEIHYATWECEAESREQALEKYENMDVYEIGIEYSHTEEVTYCEPK